MSIRPVIRFARVVREASSIIERSIKCWKIESSTWKEHIASLFVEVGWSVAKSERPPQVVCGKLFPVYEQSSLSLRHASSQYHGVPLMSSRLSDSPFALGESTQREATTLSSVLPQATLASTRRTVFLTTLPQQALSRIYFLTKSRSRPIDALLRVIALA